MFFRLVWGGIARRRWRALLTLFTMLLGVSLATAILNVMLDVGDKFNRELRTYGANLRVVPRSAAFLADFYGLEEGEGVTDKYLREDELPRLKTIFWAYNIVDFAPLLTTPVVLEGVDQPVTAVGTWFNQTLSLPTGDTVTTGVQGLKSWWSLKGAWPGEAASDPAGVALGESLARRLRLSPGESLVLTGQDGVRRTLPVTGVFLAGGREDGQIYVPLALAQAMAGKTGLVEEVEVSALTTPENDLARRAAQSPASLSAKEWETWYCTAYISSIAYQIEEVLTDARAKPVLAVAEAEGKILGKVELLLTLLAILALVASALALANLVTAGVMERRVEIGILKAIGAGDLGVISLVVAEVLLAGGVGGGLGYLLGIGLSDLIGQSVFGASISPHPAVIPLVLVLVFLVSVVGTLPAIRLLLRLNPREVLHGR
ncbi:MAG: ABC transporter permease [Planctomycetota bacterium]|jgi:putative ABC transport system permease protein|nr:ABC transporter permease [Planctomycetota bacterium]